MSFILYHTLGCHLCELAEQEIEKVRESGMEISYELVDIADNDDLMAQYGVEIPVLFSTTDKTSLKWPFSAHDIGKWL